MSITVPKHRIEIEEHPGIANLLFGTKYEVVAYEIREGSSWDRYLGVKFAMTLGGARAAARQLVLRNLITSAMAESEVVVKAKMS